MIRSTRNEGISSVAKQRHAGAGLINNGIGGGSLELVADVATQKVLAERRDNTSTHSATETPFPSSEFNGTFE